PRSSSHPTSPSSPRPPTPSTLSPYSTLFRSLTFPSVQESTEAARWVADLEAKRRTRDQSEVPPPDMNRLATATSAPGARRARTRSEEHTSELQSRFDLVCRLLLEQKYQPEPA